MPSEDSKKDRAWKYGYLANEMVKNNVTCKFCSKESKGGIHRLKQHLVGGFRNVTACPKCPEDVKKEMTEYMWKKKSEKNQKILVPDLNDVVLEDEEESENAIIATRGKRIVRKRNSSNKKPRQVGPMDDALCTPKSATQSRKEKQTTINDASRKKLRDKAFAYIERWRYEASIPFNAITLDSFRDALVSLVRYGVGMKLESYYEVKEEVKLALKMHLNSMKQNGGKEVHISESRSLQLKFLSNLSLPVFTGSLIEREDCSNIQVALVDAFTGQTVISGPESSAKVEIVVLEGDFDGDENDNWTVDEFKNNIVREREGKEPLLTGDAFLNLKEGIGLVGDISFTDNSSWTRSRRFRLGARVVDSTDGTRVREAKTKSFTVDDHPGESYKKHHPPSLSDEVWRLENIGKDGAFHKHLSQENVNTVKDFLILLLIDAPRLQNILGTGMSAEMWEVTVEHARTCVLDKGMFLYCPSSSQQKTGVVFNVVGQVMGILSEFQYVTIDKLSETEKADAHSLLISALDHWGEVVPFDDEASLVGSTLQLTNVLYNEGSPDIDEFFVIDPLFLEHSTDFAIYNAQRRWTKLSSVLKCCFSIMKSANLKKKPTFSRNSDLQWIEEKKMV